MTLSSGQPLVDILSLACPQGDLGMGQPTSGHPPVMAVPLTILHLMKLAEELLPLTMTAPTPAQSLEEERRQWPPLRLILLVSER